MVQRPMPDTVSTWRKLAQPFVRQYGRWVAATEARRRSRRIELERPATAVVMVREVIPCSSCRGSGPSGRSRGDLALDGGLGRSGDLGPGGARRSGIVLCGRLRCGLF